MIMLAGPNHFNPLIVNTIQSSPHFNESQLMLYHVKGLGPRYDRKTCDLNSVQPAPYFVTGASIRDGTMGYGGCIHVEASVADLIVSDRYRNPIFNQFSYFLFVLIALPPSDRTKCVLKYC